MRAAQEEWDSRSHSFESSGTVPLESPHEKVVEARLHCDKLLRGKDFDRR